MNDDLHFVQVPFGEERTNRTIDQARSQRLFLGRTALTLEEAAGNTARSVALLDIVNGKRDVILAGLGILAGDHRRQYNGIFDRHEHGAGRLARDFSGLQCDRMLAVLEGFDNFIEHGNSFLFLPTDFQALSFTSPRMDTIHLAAQSLVRLENTKPQMTKCLHQQADTGILSINRTENVATKLLAQAE